MFFSVLEGARACGVANAIYKQLCLSHWACAAGFNNNINNNNRRVNMERSTAGIKAKRSSDGLTIDRVYRPRGR